MLHRPAIRRLAGLAGLLISSASCGDAVRTGRSPAYLVINQLEGANGNKSTTFFTYLLSDVLTNVTSPPPCTTNTPCPTTFNDPGRVTLSLAMKDVSLAPTANNLVTIN